MKKKIPWHYHDKARGIYLDGVKEIDLAPIEELKEKFDNGDSSVLDELVDRIVETQEEKNSKKYLLIAAKGGNKTAEIAVNNLQTKSKNSNNDIISDIDWIGVFSLGVLIIFIVAGIGIWYYYNVFYALAFVLVTVLLWLAIIFVTMKVKEKRYAAADKHDMSDYARYGIDLRQATAKELVEYFHMTYSIENGQEFVNLGRHQYVLNERKEIFLERKQEVIQYLKERQVYINSYYKKLDNIRGLEEYFYLLKLPTY